MKPPDLCSRDIIEIKYTTLDTETWIPYEEDIPMNNEMYSITHTYQVIDLFFPFKTILVDARAYIANYIYARNRMMYYYIQVV